MGNPSARAPPATTTAPRSSASATCVVHLRRAELVVERSERRRFRERVAEADVALDLRREAGHELLAHRLVHEQPLGSGAALARAEKAADLRRLRRGVEVGIVQDDEGAVAAHLQQLHLAGGLARHDHPGLGRAGERHGVGAGVDRELVAHLRAGAEHEVEHARGKVRLGDALGEDARAHRRRRCGSPHDRAAARERRREHLGRHRVRPVPGGDEPQDSDWAAQEKHTPAGRRALRDPPLDALGVLGRHAEELDQLPDLALRLGLQWLALVEGADARELVAAAARRRPPRGGESRPARTPSAPPMCGRPSSPPQSHAARPRGSPRRRCRAIRRSRDSWPPRCRRWRRHTNRRR